MILCAIAGGLITTLFNFVRYSIDIINSALLYNEILIMLISAIVAGAIMGGVITYLPGLREVKRNHK
ncbi:putative inner membrane protein [Salmonella enterica subsp. enterica serovar Enteritidis str. SARB17]|nr:putative inner membrane protein [Salmonella enterica subsp. enterica serovar Enteritidis str. SARB17]